MPQNIESLVPSQIELTTEKSLLASLQDELLRLRKANAVFCISREEQWLLNLHGIEADFFPYYPPKAVLNEMVAIRKDRNDSVKNRFLILGTAINAPTLFGMQKQLQFLKVLSKQAEFFVDVAGFGTEKLRDVIFPNLTIHGSVSSTKLRELIVMSKAVLVYQISGAGALTRIPEMLAAGVPVIANSMAARSAFAYLGVYVHDSTEELLRLMMSELEVPPIPVRPLQAEKRLIDCIHKLSDQII